MFCLPCLIECAPRLSQLSSLCMASDTHHRNSPMQRNVCVKGKCQRRKGEGWVGGMHMCSIGCEVPGCTPVRPVRKLPPRPVLVCKAHLGTDKHCSNLILPHQTHSMCMPRATPCRHVPLAALPTVSVCVNDLNLPRPYSLLHLGHSGKLAEQEGGHVWDGKRWGRVGRGGGVGWCQGLSGAEQAAPGSVSIKRARGADASTRQARA